MKCPFCRETTTDVYNTRSTKSGTQIWRRRRCLACNKTFTTYEQPDLGFVRVQTPVGKAQHYSRAKLFGSIYLAFEASRATSDTIDAVTDTVEGKILDTKLDLIPSTTIAGIILTALKHFDTSAFLRYLSSHSEVRSNRELRKIIGKY
jgi:transcriptional repressor NrdR